MGSIGILASHEPLLAMLEPTELRLYRSESEIVRFAQAEGYLQFAENHALVLVEEAIAPEAIDRQSFGDRSSPESRSAPSARRTAARRRRTAQCATRPPSR